MVSFHKEKIVFFLLILIPLVFAAVPASVQQTAQQECLDQNPSNKTVWTFEITQDSPSQGAGGIVVSEPIWYEAIPNSSSSTVYYSNCVQIDCIQNPSTTQSVPLYCQNQQFVSKNYDITYSFPTCEANYEENLTPSPDPICVTCPSAQILNEYQASGCFEGKVLLKRDVTTYYSSACTPSAFIEYKVSNTPCSSTNTIFLLGVFLVLAGFLVTKTNLKILKS